MWWEELKLKLQKRRLVWNSPMKLNQTLPKNFWIHSNILLRQSAFQFERRFIPACSQPFQSSDRDFPSSLKIFDHLYVLRKKNCWAEGSNYWHSSSIEDRTRNREPNLYPNLKPRVLWTIHRLFHFFWRFMTFSFILIFFRIFSFNFFFEKCKRTATTTITSTTNTICLPATTTTATDE